MSKLLINQVKLVEKYKQAIPLMEDMLASNAYYFMAGSLILTMKDPVTGCNFTEINIKPMDDYASDIIRKGQYLASQIYVKHKEPTCFSYDQALENIKIYEQAHGRELEPTGTVEIN